MAAKFKRHPHLILQKTSLKSYSSPFQGHLQATFPLSKMQQKKALPGGQMHLRVGGLGSVNTSLLFQLNLAMDVWPRPGLFYTQHIYSAGWLIHSFMKADISNRS